MKPLAIATLTLGLVGCASHRQIACRFVAVDERGTILKAPTAQMHSHWHNGFSNCSSMIGALQDGYVTATITGDKAGVEVKGPKAERMKLKQLFNPAPIEPLNTTEALPRFKKLMEIAE
jgi:hypothetical protein